MPTLTAVILLALAGLIVAFVRQHAASLGAVAAAVGVMAAAGLPIASAGAANVMDGMPSQASADRASTDPGNSGQTGWGDMAGGVAARPYVVSMTIINGGVSTPVITAGSTNSPSVPEGQLTAVVSAFNLCRPGQAAAQGTCYATPNRVGLTVGYSAGQSDGYNFAEPSVPVSPTVNSESIIDMTVALNTLGQSLRWTWINGDLLYWQTTNLGEGSAMVHIRFKPASAPYLRQFPQNSGCTATPIFNCNIPTAEGQVLTASMVFSLDNTLDSSLTGAAFATQNAIYGYLQPGGSSSAPALEIQMASTHTNAQGAPQQGTLQAFIPASALLHYYGVLPVDATSAFTTTRAGDPGTNEPPQYEAWATATNGSEGLLATIKGISFSVPSYRVTDKLRPAVAHATARGAKTTVKATIAGCTARSRCLASLYDLGPRHSRRYTATGAALVATHKLSGRDLVIAVPAAKLKRGNGFLLVLRLAKGKKLLVSTSGSVR
jgi:hypothetical protein